MEKKRHDANGQCGEMKTDEKKHGGANGHCGEMESDEKKHGGANGHCGENGEGLRGKTGLCEPGAHLCYT